LKYKRAKVTIQKGMQEGMREIAKKMIAKGNSNEEIVELTNLTMQKFKC